MLRLSLFTLALSVWTTGTVSARLASPKPFEKPASIRLSASATELATPTAPAPASGVQMTEDTEVYLNGKSCTFAEIPANATVTRMVVGGDGKTVTLVEFSTAK